MKKAFFVIICLIILINSTWGQILPDWDKEQLIATDVDESKYIDTANMLLKRTILNAITYLSYEAYLYETPVIKVSDSYLKYRGLTLSNFPRTGSSDHTVIWECIDDYIKRSAARPGDYIEMYIHKISEREWNIVTTESPPYIYILVRIESDGTLKGSIWKK